MDYFTLPIYYIHNKCVVPYCLPSAKMYFATAIVKPFEKMKKIKYCYNYFMLHQYFNCEEWYESIFFTISSSMVDDRKWESDCFGAMNRGKDAFISVWIRCKTCTYNIVQKNRNADFFASSPQGAAAGNVQVQYYPYKNERAGFKEHYNKYGMGNVELWGWGGSIVTSSIIPLHIAIGNKCQWQCLGKGLARLPAAHLLSLPSTMPNIWGVSAKTVYKEACTARFLLPLLEG